MILQTFCQSIVTNLSTITGSNSTTILITFVQKLSSSSVVTLFYVLQQSRKFHRFSSHDNLRYKYAWKFLFLLFNNETRPANWSRIGKIGIRRIEELFQIIFFPSFIRRFVLFIAAKWDRFLFLSTSSSFPDIFIRIKSTKTFHLTPFLILFN